MIFLEKVKIHRIFGKHFAKSTYDTMPCNKQIGSRCAAAAEAYSSMVILVMTGMSIGLFQVSGPRVG